MTGKWRPDSAEGEDERCQTEVGLGLPAARGEPQQVAGGSAGMIAVGER